MRHMSSASSLQVKSFSGTIMAALVMCWNRWSAKKNNRLLSNYRYDRLHGNHLPKPEPELNPNPNPSMSSHSSR